MFGQLELSVLNFNISRCCALLIKVYVVSNLCQAMSCVLKSVLLSLTWNSVLSFHNSIPVFFFLLCPNIFHSAFYFGCPEFHCRCVSSQYTSPQLPSHLCVFQSEISSYPVSVTHVSYLLCLVFIVTLFIALVSALVWRMLVLFSTFLLSSLVGWLTWLPLTWCIWATFMVVFFPSLCMFVYLL